MRLLLIAAVSVLLQNGCPALAVVISGSGQSAGYLKGCQVLLEQGAAHKTVSGSATTDANGKFTMNVTGATSIKDVVGAYITIPASPTCLDSTTMLPSPSSWGRWSISLPTAPREGPFLQW
eukprot:jgi/Botrbrau1/20703/Bobra.0058s0032.1